MPGTRVPLSRSAAGDTTLFLLTCRRTWPGSLNVNDTI